MGPSVAIKEKSTDRKARQELTWLAGGAWLASKFLLGQGLAQALMLLVGLLLLRLLSIEQYALYTVAGTLLALVTVGSNFGLSQAIVSLGAARRDDKYHLGALLDAARRLTRYLMGPTMIATAIVAYMMMRVQPWPLDNKIICVILIFLIGVAQIESSLGRAILNIHHDARATFRVSFAEAGTRLLLLPLVSLWPTAALALLANLAGAIAASILTARRTRELCHSSDQSEAIQTSQLIGFIVPIAPMVIYAVAQGQIAILLLTAFAEPRAIAETGALSRLGQVFNVLQLINPFLIQPVFARIVSRTDFAAKSAAVISALLVLCIFTITSTYVVPNWWLLIIGDKYSGLAQELPIALAVSLATIVGGTLYTMVIARGSTRWQSTAILPCLGGQLVFVAVYGVHTTWHALMLSLIPAVAYALVQTILLTQLLRNGSLSGRALAD